MSLVCVSSRAPGRCASGSRRVFGSADLDLAALLSRGAGRLDIFCDCPLFFPTFGAPPDQESAIFALVWGIVEGCNGSEGYGFAG